MESPSGFILNHLALERTTSRTSLAASTRRKRESMSEKRARRKNRQQREINLPKRSRKVTLVEQSNGPASESLDSAPVQPSSSMSKAQELVDKQRRSVAMLTLVKESIEKISSEEATAALANDGYFVMDNFLNQEGTIDELQQEGVRMLDNGLAADLENLASGMFVGPIKGGEEQYLVCPRSIEYVVSTTKHFGSMVLPDMALDGEKCLGRMRTFDRQAFQAAKDLLVGQEAGEGDESNRHNAPFQRIVDSTDQTDQRRLSLRYYLVDNDWSFGGGVEFDNGGHVEAKRDRLVLWKSAETALRERPWKGDADHRFGSCLELDLI